MIKKGDRVKVEYEGRFEDGKVFDSSSHGDHSHPLEFEVGSGQVIKGFDDAVAGMKINEKKEITILPAEAYGEYDNRLIHEVPKTAFPKDMELEEGVVLGMMAPTGQQIPAKVVEVLADKVKLDLNHPLAGKKLIFKLRVVGC